MSITTRHAYAAVTFLLLGLLCLAGTVGAPPTESAPELPPAWEEAARRLAPTGLRIAAAAHGPCRLEGSDASGSVRWHAVFSAWLEPRPAGYAGPVDLVAGFDDAGRITGVRILGHRETPTFVAGLEEEWFLGQFPGKTAGDALQPGEDLDGLTRATTTVEAVCQALRQGFAAASHGSTAVGPQKPASAAPGRQFRSHAPLAALAVAAAAALLQRFIGAMPAAAIVVLSIGYAVPQFLSLTHLRLLSGGHPAPQTLALLLLAGLALLATRRGYCRYLCPCGRAQDLAHGLSLYIFNNTLSIGGTRFRGAGRALLWTTLLLLPLAGSLPLERIEAFSALFLGTLSGWGLLLAGAVLLGAVLMPRFYCRLLCPLNPLFVDLEALRRRLPGPNGNR
ncbi:MAG TPA: FMN-binding protein [Candidatus Ozemobacteraceae bacterium]|nr:FMN-binding protein [Candidatus Ozemobacteraceae bacterium]